METEVVGRAKGGKALAEKMTSEERKAKSMAMVEAKKYVNHYPMLRTGHQTSL